MPFERLPGNFIYWFNIESEKHEKIKQMLLPKIELEESEASETTTNYFPLGSDAFTNYSKRPSYMLDDFITNTIVWDPVDDMIKRNNETDNYQISIDKSKIVEHWFTSYKVGDFFERHHHKGFPTIPSGENEYYYPTFSFIYILQDDNQKNSTTFIDTNAYMFSPHVETSIHTSDICDIKEGTVMIFPVHLTHAVKKNVKGKRITLAYNISSTFKNP